MKQLYVVGTSHFDLNGPERLKKLINYIKPAFIMCEGNTEPEYVFKLREFSLTNFEDNREKLIAQFGDSGFNKIYDFVLMTGYEQWIPFQYSQSQPSVQVHSLSSNEFEHKKEINIEDSDFSKLLDDSTEIIEAILTTDVEEYQSIMESNYFNCHAEVPEPNQIDRITELDKRYAEKTRTLYKSHKGSGLVIMGVGHIFGNYENLASRFIDLLPNRLKLIEVDKL